MTNVFISYSSKDGKTASWLYSEMTKAGIKTFMADVSIKAGAKWSEVILSNLKSSQWVFFIASKNANNSHAVQQELGAALIQDKIIIPIIIDMEPEDLPAWIQGFQAIDIKKAPQKIYQTIREIAETIQNNKFLAGATIAIIVLIIFICVYFNKKK